MYQPFVTWTGNGGGGASRAYAKSVFEHKIARKLHEIERVNGELDPFSRRNISSKIRIIYPRECIQRGNVLEKFSLPYRIIDILQNFSSIMKNREEINGKRSLAKRGI